MFLRDHARVIAEQALALVDVLSEQGRPRTWARSMPGRTHLQHAQPVLLTHHLLAHAWPLVRDVDRLADWAARVAGRSGFPGPFGASEASGLCCPICPFCRRRRNRGRRDWHRRWTIEDDVEFFFRGRALRSSACAPTSISKASTRTWSTRLSTMLRADGAPDFLKLLLISMVVTKAATSIGRDKFDLQILDARFREIDDAQNPFVVQAVVGSQEQHALFRGPAAQDSRHARGQFGCRDLLIAQGHATVRRKPLSCRGLEDGARRGADAQDQLRFLGLRGRGIAAKSRGMSTS